MTEYHAFNLSPEDVEVGCRKRGLDPNKIQRGPLSGVRYEGASASYWPCWISEDMLDTWARQVAENQRWGLD